MTFEQLCEHNEIYYMPKPQDEVPLYQCNACKTTTLRSTLLGGTVQMNDYKAEVLAYNGLRLVKKTNTTPNETIDDRFHYD